VSQEDAAAPDLQIGDRVRHRPSGLIGFVDGIHGGDWPIHVSGVAPPIKGVSEDFTPLGSNIYDACETCHYPLDRQLLRTVCRFCEVHRTDCPACLRGDVLRAQFEGHRWALACTRCTWGVHVPYMPGQVRDGEPYRECSCYDMDAYLHGLEGEATFRMWASLVWSFFVIVCSIGFGIPVIVLTYVAMPAMGIGLLAILMPMTMPKPGDYRWTHKHTR